MAMTEKRLAEIEAREPPANNPATHTMVPIMDVRDLCAALRSAWAERDAARLHEAEAVLTEAEWWANPEREHGLRVLYPNESERLDRCRRELERAVEEVKRAKA